MGSARVGGLWREREKWERRNLKKQEGECKPWGKDKKRGFKVKMFIKNMQENQKREGT